MPATLIALPAGDDEAAGILRGVRFGLPREYFVAGMEPGVEARIREAVAALEAAGATVEEVSLPHTDYGLATYYIVAPAEASANLARYDGIRYGLHAGDGDTLARYLATRGNGFGAEVKRRIMLGTYALSAGYYDAYYLKAQKVRTLIKGDFDKVWATGVDALVAPTSATVAFRFGARLADPVSMYLSDACTLPVNMAGLPGVSVPCGLSEGLPVGLQFIGPACRLRVRGSLDHRGARLPPDLRRLRAGRGRRRGPCGESRGRRRLPGGQGPGGRVSRRAGDEGDGWPGQRGIGQDDRHGQARGRTRRRGVGVGLVNIVLWLAGVVLIAVGYQRARVPWARYQELKAQDANVARYESWRGGVRNSDSQTGASVAMAVLRRQAQIGAGIAIAGVVLVFVGFLIR